MSSKKHGSNLLKGVGSFRVSPEVTSEVISSYLESLDCPRSLTVAILYRYGEHDQLSGLEFDPLLYNDFRDCRDAYAATKFLSKFKGLTLNHDLDEVAIEKFESFELLCKQTNSRFRDLSRDPLFKGRAVWLHNAVIRKIDEILGEFYPQDFFEMPDWGPGASTLIKRRSASSTNKFQCETGITRELHRLIPLDMLAEVYPPWAYHLSRIGFPKFEIGNKVITVPKDAKANRVIAIEPGINLWFQKALGEMIGLRLRRCGVDLRYQETNQRLAYLGSLNLRWATVDMSSASDSISYAVVEALLPPRWFSVMDSCRSHYGRLGARTLKWEKFSSMGNGFTFQLESLIFYAVAFCCAEYLHVSKKDMEGVSSYGDDIIIPVVCRDLFSLMMSFYGFRINDSKSHFDSKFRESCGAHYYEGHDVKPIYLKDKLSSLLSVFRMANAVRRLSRRRQSYGCDERFRSTFELLVQKVPSALRFRIPDGFGDGGFISSFDEATPIKMRRGINRIEGYEGYYCRHLTEVSLTYQEDRVGYLLSNLWSSGPSVDLDLNRKSRARLKAIADLTASDRSGSGRNSVPLIGRKKLRLAYSLVQQWCDLGPWI